MLKKKFYIYRFKERGIEVYEAAIHDLSDVTVNYLVHLLAKRYKISKRGVERRLIYLAKRYCYLPFPNTLHGIWEKRVDGAARSYKEQVDELRP